MLLNHGCLHCTRSMCMFPLIHSDLRMSPIFPPDIKFPEKLQPYSQLPVLRCYQENKPNDNNGVTVFVVRRK